MKYNEYIMRNVRGNLDLEIDDTSKDDLIMEMSKKEVLERYFIWEGICGYTDIILDLIYDIYGVDLSGK